MKKLTKEEAEGRVMVTNGRTTKIWAAVAGLLTGEVLIIERKDWTGKRPPYDVVKRVAKKTNHQYEWGRSLDGKGWEVRRLA